MIGHQERPSENRLRYPSETSTLPTSGPPSEWVILYSILSTGALNGSKISSSNRWEKNSVPGGMEVSVVHAAYSGGPCYNGGPARFSGRPGFFRRKLLTLN